MHSVLSALSLIASFVLSGAVASDGRADWQGYAWQSRPYAQCPALDEAGLCHPYHEKWDWKRDQWVDLLYRADPASGALQVRLRLTNNDIHDEDYVCVTALFLDAEGADVFAFHQNWHIGTGQVLDRSFSFSAAASTLKKAATIAIGSKQCRDGGHQDEAVFAGVKRLTGQPD
jgi:hypothetical protein